GRVVGAGRFALGFVGLQREAIVFPDEMVLEQSFVDGAELLNAEVAEVHGFNGQGGLLRVGDRIEEQTSEDTGKDGVTYAPLFEVGMAGRIEQSAVVTRDFVFGVFPFVGAIDSVAKLLDILVQAV